MLERNLPIGSFLSALIVFAHPIKVVQAQNNQNNHVQTSASDISNQARDKKHSN
jgi:hypothetical protein